MAGSDLDGDEFGWDNRLFLNHWNGCRTDMEGKLGFQEVSTDHFLK